MATAREESPGGTVAYASKRGRGVLLASVLGSGMAFLDSTAVNVALPALGRELGAGLSGLQWAVDAYLLTLSALVLTGGALGDLLGQRRVFLWGVAAFTLTSVLCGLAPSATQLALWRAAQGVGAAMLVPTSLALLRTSFSDAERTRAVAAWAGLSGVTTAVGPLLGGWLVDALSWRAVFFINVPLAFLTAAVARRSAPAPTPRSGAPRLDGAGAASVSLGLGGLTYALIEGPAHGWSAPPLLAGIVGVLSFAAFLAIEARVPSPMLPLDLFRSRTFTGANLTTLAVYFALGGTTFFIVIALQQELGYSALAAGLSLLPLTVLMLVLSPQVGRLAQRLGTRPFMVVGPWVVGAGLALLTRLSRGGSYAATVLPGVLVLGLGLALTVGPLTSVVLGSVEERHAGVASGVNNAVARIAGLLAVALLPLLGGLAGNPGADFLVGVHRTLWLSAGLCVLGGVCSLVTLPPDRSGPRG